MLKYYQIFASNLKNLQQREKDIERIGKQYEEEYFKNFQQGEDSIQALDTHIKLVSQQILEQEQDKAELTTKIQEVNMEEELATSEAEEFAEMIEKEQDFYQERIMEFKTKLQAQQNEEKNLRGILDKVLESSDKIEKASIHYILKAGKVTIPVQDS